MRILILSLTLFVIFTSNGFAGLPFKVGQTYSNFIQLSKVGVKYQLPLPKGEWLVTAVNDRAAQRSASASAQATSGTKLADIYLANIVQGKIKMAIAFTYPYELYSSGWSVPKFCYRDNLHFDERPELYSGTQTDCWGISIIPMGAARKGSAAARSIAMIQKQGAKIPTLSVYARYYRANYSEYFTAGYYFNPEFYGISKPGNVGSFKTVDYNPNLIGDFPEKKIFVDNVIKWGKAWKKLFDLGFEGKLGMDEINNQPIFSPN
jgi:hypothetical protein